MPRNHGVTEQEKDKAVELYTKYEMTYENIGRRLGISAVSVSKIMKERNIQPNKSRRL